MTTPRKNELSLKAVSVCRRLVWLPLACLLLPACVGPATETEGLSSDSASSGALPASVAAWKPTRIMSMMLCNDVLLLMMVPKDRIASITYLAHDAIEALLPGADTGVAVNYGTAEEILLQKPDLILAGTDSAPVARKLAKTVGARMVEVEAANSFSDIRRIVGQVGQAVGEPGRAHALLAEMDRKLAWLASHQPAQSLRVVAWSGSQAVPGKGTLTNEIIAASGAENIAARLPDNRYGSFGLEALLAARPDAILQGETRWSGPSLQDAQSMHPLIERYWRGRRISYPDAAYACGLPQSADAAIALRNLYRELPAGRPRW
jgi:iron complex transport system substrate-binding protein